jgi:hypothetical protein
VRELTSLETLRLSLSRFTDVGLRCLAGLVGLRRLDLKFTQVTDAGAIELRKALPNCRIWPERSQLRFSWVVRR